MTDNQTTFYDISNGISEVRALADTLVHLDIEESELFKRASPYLLRILADKTAELDKAHCEFEKELIELQRNQRPS